jgi:hypothetical protein
MPSDDKHADDDAPPRASLGKIVRKYVRNGLDEVLYHSHATHMPSDVFAYGREAHHCFADKRYLATIMMSVAQVEIILNKDGRLPKGEGWRHLDMKLLKAGSKNGLPVHCLFGQGESLKARSAEFIDLRNRIAHGNLDGIIGFEEDGTPDYSFESRVKALTQMRKATAFVMEWYNTSPDVQQRRIVHGRWPKRVKPGLKR